MKKKKKFKKQKGEPVDLHEAAKRIKERFEKILFEDRLKPIGHVKIKTTVTIKKQTGAGAHNVEGFKYVQEKEIPVFRMTEFEKLEDANL